MTTQRTISGACALSVLLCGLALSAERAISLGEDLIAIANAAKPGDALLVRPGQYPGGTLRRSGVTIRGEGRVLIQGRLTLEASNVTLEGLTWEDQNSQLLDIRGARNLVRKCSFRRFGLKAASKAIWIRDTGNYSHNVIEECLFEDWGGKRYHSSCIKVGQYTNRDAHVGTIIRNCTFRRGAVGGNNPAIQPFCAATIEGNTIHDCEDGIEVKGNHMVVRNNVVFRCFGGEAMSNRSGSGNLFEGNLLYDIPMGAWQIWTGRGNVWRNNVVVNCGRIAQLKGHNVPEARAADALIINNTFVGCTRGITWNNRKFAPVGIRILNNIFVGKGGKPVIESPKQAESTAEYVEDYNFVVGYGPPVGRALGAHSAMGKAPLFVDAGKRDFRLRPGSPGIDAGLLDPEIRPKADKAGVPRPQGEGVDMGAFESMAP